MAGTRKITVTFPQGWIWRATVRKVQLGPESRTVVSCKQDEVERLCDEVGMDEICVRQVGKLAFVAAQPRGRFAAQSSR